MHGRSVKTADSAAWFPKNDAPGQRQAVVVVVVRDGGVEEGVGGSLTFLL